MIVAIPLGVDLLAVGVTVAVTAAENIPKAKKVLEAKKAAEKAAEKLKKS